MTEDFSNVVQDIASEYDQVTIKTVCKTGPSPMAELTVPHGPVKRRLLVQLTSAYIYVDDRVNSEDTTTLTVVPYGREGTDE